MSLGTFISALPRKVTEAITAAFAELPHKVIWHFVGEKPSSLGNNTLLLEWLPQSDLLGHPKTRAFVAHGGTNGMYEAIYHSVPVVGLPLLLDQLDNLLRLKVRGAARVVELHRDKPMTPMDTAIFWIEYVIRNKGAPHLQSAGFHLPWYSYFCLDVAALTIAITGIFIWALVFVCRPLCCRRSKRKMKPE
uniref:UDP-glucuronosyltransferase n=1 Tax=Pundamilia nyererei TaxID=303518 RepID=A0A3B4GJ26_9CICH